VLKVVAHVHTVPVEGCRLGTGERLAGEHFGSGSRVYERRRDLRASAPGRGPVRGESPLSRGASRRGESDGPICTVRVASSTAWTTLGEPMAAHGSRGSHPTWPEPVGTTAAAWASATAALHRELRQVLAELAARAPRREPSIVDTLRDRVKARRIAAGTDPGDA